MVSTPGKLFQPEAWSVNVTVWGSRLASVTGEAGVMVICAGSRSYWLALILRSSITPVQPAQSTPLPTPVTTLTPPSVPNEVGTMFVPGTSWRDRCKENTDGSDPAAHVIGALPVTTHPLVFPVGTVTVANCPATAVVGWTVSVRAPPCKGGPSTRRFG